MTTNNNDLRKLLSLNIKKQRKFLNLTQEKLAESTGISIKMMNDIEGCRTWVSDKTLLNITKALEIEVYRLFMPVIIEDEDRIKPFIDDLVKDLREAKTEAEKNYENILKLQNLIS